MSIRAAPRIEIGLLIMLCAATLAVSTRWGVAVAPDSTAYLGFRSHDLGHAPLYSWLMRLAAAVAPIDVTAIARWYHVALYAATAGLAWHLIHAATGSRASAWAGACLIAFTSQGIIIYSSALSEPTFVALQLLSITLLSAWADRHSARLLVLAILVAGLGALARYAGIALIGTGMLTIAVVGRMPAPRRYLAAGAFGAAAVLPAAFWMAFVRIVTGTVGGRSLSLSDTVDAETFEQGLMESARFLLPAQFPAALRVIALIVALALIAYATVRCGRTSGAVERSAHRFLPFIVGAFIFCYGAVLLLSVLIEPYLPIVGRYLFPLYVAVVILGAITIPRLRLAAPAHALVVAAVCGLVTLGIVRGAKETGEGHREGRAFTSRSWRFSEAVGHVRALPPRAAVYTNAYYALLFLTQRDVHEVPRKIFRRLGSANPRYELELAEMRREILETDGVIVWFEGMYRQVDLPTLNELGADMRLSERKRLADAIVYTIAPERGGPGPSGRAGRAGDGGSR